MTLLFGTVIVVIAIIAFVYLNEKNANKPYEQIQMEAAEVACKNNSVDDLLKRAQEMIPLTEAMIQAGIVGDHFAVDAINQGTYHGPLPERRSNGGWLSIYDNLRIFNIAGINRRQGIGKYVGRVECVLVPEPTNEYDPNAIKVVSDDRHHLGYIPAEHTDFVRSLTANEFPYKCTAFIEEREDEIDRRDFFIGFVYIKRLD